ncbi:MAG: RecQ family ATP-dependent DNA helicase [Prevotella sp.]|nr:RecQ family ATP-dependent DNA helicase [Prevotella sp.]
MDRYKEVLRRYWGYDDFRGIQRDIIESIGSGKDTLGLMPTGGGKSVTFQVPALAGDGVCIVVTPLIALMKDQVANLKRRGIRSAAIYSGLSHDEILTILENCVFGAVRILYISPERLSSQLFQTKLRHIKVSFFAIDEAHCISQWGYDFRPSYLKISDIRRLHPDVPVLALTATATPEVVDDIQDKLGFKEKRVFKMSFERKNLAYIVRRTMDKQGELIHILECVDGCAIVYVRSRRRAKEVSDILNGNGITATFYHAGLENAEKDKRQKDWQEDKVRVMVATNAFGMGIDKPDVRIVAHIDCPNSIEAYFQEAGRAGRDGNKAYAVMLYNDGDRVKLTKRISETFPEKEYIKQVYEHLAYFYQVAVGAGYGMTFEFNIDKFCRNFKHFPVPADAALKILNRAGYIEYTEEQDSNARVMFTVSRDNLYRLKNNSVNEDKIIVALLRNYGGLFSDYNFIDESLLATQTEMKPHEVYLTLKLLDAKHIIKFIPRKKIPHIRYTQRREDSEHIILGKDVYEDRKRQFIQRINAIMEYVSVDDTCRSRMLLGYFGEKTNHDCGVCDVCMERNKTLTNSDAIAETQAEIMAMLNDNKRHYITELNAIKRPYEQIDAALAYLISEEKISRIDGMIYADN